MHALILLLQRSRNSGSCRRASRSNSGAQHSQKRVWFRRQQHRLQLSSPSPNCVWVALSIRHCSRQQVTGTAWCPHLRVCHPSRRTTADGCAVSLRFLRFSRTRNSSQLRSTFVVTFCVLTTHTDVYPKLLQDPSIQGDHVPYGTSYCGDPVIELWDTAIFVRRASLLPSPPQLARSTCAACTGSPGAVMPWHLQTCRKKKMVRISFQRRLARLPIVALVQGTRSTRPNIRQQAQPQRRGCSPLRILENICGRTCAWLSKSCQFWTILR